MSEQVQEVFQEIDPVAAAMNAAVGNDVEATTADTTGKDVVPPASDQAVETPVDAATKEAPTPSTEQESDEISDEALQRALADQLGTSTENAEEKVKRDLAASSKEARRLNDVVKGVQESLAAQGIELSLAEDGSYVGLRAKGTPNAESFPSAPEVDSDMQDRLFQDPQAEISRIWDEAQKAAEITYANPAAEIETVSEPPSQEVLQDAKNAVKESKDLYGNTMYPNYDRLEPVVSNMLKDLPPRVVEGFNEHPEVFLRLLHDSAENARTRLIQGVKAEQNKKKEEQEKAQGDANLLPGGDATIQVGAGGAASSAAALAEHIAKAEII